MQASPSSIERSSSMPLKQRNIWKYHDSIPLSAKIDRYFYGYDAMEELTTWDDRETKRLQRIHGWRWRFDPTTRRREYYLMDMLVTSFSYMQDWVGQRIDSELLENARDYQRLRLAESRLGA